MSVINIGQHVLTLSNERDAYAQLRRKYLDNAYSEKTVFLDDFSDTFSDCDALFQHFPDYLENVLVEITDVALADISAHRIYDVDEGVFGEHFATHLSGRENQFEQLYSRYQAIVLSAAELQAYREDRAAHRGQVMGGGLGIEGAATGMVVGAVANVAIGMAHGLANATGGAISSVADRRKKSELYKDPATKDGLASLVFDAAFVAHLAVVEIINERCDAHIFDPVSPLDKVKATALVKNVVKNRVPAKAQAEILFEALSLNPFAKEAWFEWLSRFGDEDGSLTSASEKIGGIGLLEQKRRMIADKLADLSVSTQDECTSALTLMEQYAGFLGATIETERNLLIQKGERIEVEARSFEGTIYDTVEAACAVSKKVRDEELDRIAYELSTKDIVIKREGDHLIVDRNASISDPTKENVNLLLKCAISKRRTQIDILLLFVFVISGVALTPFGGLGLILLLIAFVVWQRTNSRIEDAVRADCPDIFELLTNENDAQMQR